VNTSARLLSLKLLGQDLSLELVSLQITESLSQPFAIQAEVILNQNMSTSDFLGKAVNINIAHSDVNQVRYFHGIITEISSHDVYIEKKALQLIIEPQFSRLKYSQDCRIFQHQSTIEIIKLLFKECEFTNVEYRLIKSYSQRNYCVQFNESLFHFIHRLLEGEGIYYYFRHDKVQQNHYLVLVDDLSQCPLFHEKIIYSNTNAPAEMYLYQWLPMRSRVIERSEENQFTVHAKGYYRTLCAGMRFTLDAKNYYITEITHYAKEASQVAAAAMHEQAEAYFNQFSARVITDIYQPEKQHHKILISGMQVAIVTGPVGEEIYTNETGCVKVQFPWDRRGKNDENSSCWIPVNQRWAGNGYGFLFLPRVGTKVMVTFLEGDPDQPIILRAVADAENVLPYRLPADRDRSGWKDHANELQFYDKWNQETLFWTVAKDMQIKVGQDEKITIARNDELTVTSGDQAIRVKGQYQLKASDSILLSAGESSLHITANEINIVSHKIEINSEATGSTAAGATTNKDLHELGDTTALVDGVSFEERQPKAPEKSPEKLQTTQKRKTPPSAKAMLCIPVVPRWRCLTPYKNLDHPATILRLPAPLRKKVYKAILKQFSPIANSIEIQKDPMKIQEAGLYYENVSYLPDLMQWQSLLQQEDSSLNETVKATLPLLSKDKHIAQALNPGWIYVFTRRAHAKYYLFAEYAVSDNSIFTEVDLSIYAGRNCRVANSHSTEFIAIPYRDTAGQDCETVVCYSDIQWSWPRLHAMGGMDPNDPRLQLAKSKPQSARALAALSNIASKPELLLQRFGEALRLQGWYNTQHDLENTAITGLDAVITKTSQRVTPDSVLQSPLEDTLMQNDLVRADAKDYPVLLLDDPVGMNVRACEDVHYYWGKLKNLVNHLAEKLTPSYVGDANMVNQNYFHSAVLANQLFYNTIAVGVSKRKLNELEMFSTDAMINVGQNAAIINANQFLDKNKIHWALRQADRRLLKYMIKNLQQTSNDMLLQKSGKLGRWGVCIKLIIADGFATASGLGYLRLLGMFSASCQRPETIDAGLDVDESIVNQFQSNTPVYRHAGLVPDKIDDEDYEQISFERVPCGYLKIEEHTVIRADNAANTRSHTTFIPDALPPGYEFYRSFHEISNPIRGCVFPKKSKENDRIYLEGDGTFWPAGFRAAWKDNHKDVLDNIFEYNRAVIGYLDKVISAYLAVESLHWSMNHNNQDEDIRDVYLLLLSHADSAFEKSHLTLQKSEKGGNKNYQLLSAVLKPKAAPSLNHDAQYAAIGKDQKLKFFPDLPSAQQAIGERQNKHKRQVATVPGELRLTYVKKDYQAHNLFDRIQSGINVFYAIYAVKDLFMQIVALDTTQGQGDIYSQIQQWLKVMISGIEVAEMGQDYLEYFTHGEEEITEIATEAEGGVTALEILGKLAVVINLSMGIFESYRAWCQGDNAAAVANGAQIVGGMEPMARSIVERIKEAGSVTAEDSSTMIVAEGEQVASEERASVASSNVLRLFNAELLATVLPIVDVIDVIFFAVYVVGFSSGLCRDDRYDTWARRSPFSIQLPPGSQYHVANPLALYEQLVNLLLQPQLSVVTTVEGPMIYNFVLNMPLLGNNARAIIESHWQLRSDIFQPDMDALKSFTVAVQSDVNRESEPLYLMPDQELIGSAQRVKFLNEAERAILQAKLQEQLLRQYPSLRDSVTTVATERLSYFVRARLEAGDIVLPTTNGGYLTKDNLFTSTFSPQKETL